MLLVILIAKKLLEHFTKKNCKADLNNVKGADMLDVPEKTDLA